MFFFSKEFRFYSKKEKTYANDLLVFSLINVIAYIYFLVKKNYCTYLKITGVKMMLSFTEPFTEKLHKQLVKTWKKRKNHVSNFSTRSIDDMKTKKKPNLFCWYKDTLQ